MNRVEWHIIDVCNLAVYPTPVLIFLPLLEGKLSGERADVTLLICYTSGVSLRAFIKCFLRWQAEPYGLKLFLIGVARVYIKSQPVSNVCSALASPTVRFKTFSMMNSESQEGCTLFFKLFLKNTCLIYWKWYLRKNISQYIVGEKCYPMVPHWG